MWPGLNKFILPGARSSYVIPASALVIDHTAMHVVIVNGEGRIHFAPVTRLVGAIARWHHSPVATIHPQSEEPYLK